MSQFIYLEDIVKNGLCIGCGLCQSITGKDSIEISMSSKGRLEPKEVKKIHSERFNKIYDGCLGVVVTCPAKLFGTGHCKIGFPRPSRRALGNHGLCRNLVNQGCFHAHSQAAHISLILLLGISTGFAGA